MSFNTNFCPRFYGKSTFHDMQAFAPPPPPPPQYFLPPATDKSSEITDIVVIKHFETKLPNKQNSKSQHMVSISEVHNQIRNLSLALNELKMEQRILSEKITELSDVEWMSHIKCVEENKVIISKILSNVNKLNTEVLRKLLAKRSSKRARQKRQRIERRKEKSELEKLKAEKSRKIDEYLQKFQDNMNKAKQEEEDKLHTDAVLKETTRKKLDSKKYIVKLDSLVKLRKARCNTAKGRGESISEKEATVFESNIEKLKSMWSKRLAIYEREEAELRSKLKQNNEESDTKRNELEREVKGNLEQWKDALFGGTLPQVDFGGDIQAFVAVRTQWDQYLDKEGSSIPIGWVPPASS